MQGLGAVDELQLGERHDAVPVERGLEREVEAGEGLDGGEPRHDEGHLHAPVLAQGELLGKQCVDSFEGVHFAALDPTHRGVEDFDGAWHFQANQAPLDAVDDGGDDLGMRGHRVLPRPARRRPTAFEAHRIRTLVLDAADSTIEQTIRLRTNQLAVTNSHDDEIGKIFEERQRRAIKEIERLSAVNPPH